LSDAETTDDQRRNTIRLRGRGSPRGSHCGALLLIVAIAVVAAGCASVANPQGWAPPHLEEGTLYASIDKGKMAALDPDDLAVKWVFPSKEDEDQFDLEGIYGTPIVDESFVYFGAYDGNVYALNAEDGTLRWAFETGDHVIGSLTLRDDTLYAGSTEGLMYAIDTTACTNSCPLSAALTFDTESSIWASPLLVEDIIYVPAMSGRLHALDAETLDPVSGFSFGTDAGLVMDPTLANDDTLLAGGIDGKLYALDPISGEEKWSFEGGNWFWGRPLVDGDKVYIADLDGNVYALGLGDGKPLWSDAFKTEAAVRSAPLLAGETLVVVDRDGNAYGLDPENGTQQWGPTLLGKTVLSDPFLLERTTSPISTDSSPSVTPDGADSTSSATPGEESPVPTDEPLPTAGAGEGESDAVVLIVAQGGDLCSIDPTDGSPAGVLLCAEVRA
jgi:outer membrane protein assembly factor BamB